VTGSARRDDASGERYVVIGATGQLGSDLVRTFDLHGELVPLSTRDVDIRDAARTRAVLEALRPTCVLNTAAYNLVDRAEDDGASAFALNAEAVGTLADVCRAAGARLVHFSTDYVFDGAKQAPYVETDPPRPISVYGESKLAGERLALEPWPARAARCASCPIRCCARATPSISRARSGRFCRRSPTRSTT
jgi:dTDP-4-dehydrorhamnose reductase